MINALAGVLEVSTDDLLLPSRPELMTATGAALAEKRPHLIDVDAIEIDALIEKINHCLTHPTASENRLDPLFDSPEAFELWQKKSSPIDLSICALEKYAGDVMFIGVDSGSTTTKIVATGENNELLFSYYASNHGNPVKAVSSGLYRLRKQLDALGARGQRGSDCPDRRYRIRGRSDPGRI